jgi:hypothetical protein
MRENHSIARIRLRSGLAITTAAMLLLILLASLAAALDSLPLLATLVGENQRDYLFQCASAGDVNGDGFDDIVVGADQMMMDVGYAYICFGGSDFDAIPDVKLIGEPFGLGGYSNFGCVVACAGDVNNDGYDDVLVSAEFGFNYDIYWRTGKVFLYFGGAEMDSIEDVVFQGCVEDDERFGMSVSGAGDVNKDGYSDVIIGAPGYPYGLGYGRAYIYFGGENMDDQFDVCLEGENQADGLGGRVKGVGDIDGDGYDDVLVGSGTAGPTHCEGKASIYLGGDAMDDIEDIVIWGDSANFHMAGIWIGGAGDVNGDGLADVIVSASSKVKLFFGGAEMDTVAHIVLTGEEPVNAPYSYEVSDAGDLNKDGFGDIMIGDPSVGDTPLGKVYVFCGGPDMDTVFDIELTGDQEPWSYFGARMASVGDLNADGFEEIAASSYGDSTRKGKVFIYTSCPTAVSDDDQEQTFHSFRLDQNYPNPFNSSTSIRYSVPSPGLKHQTHAILQIYNIRGQLVRTLVDEDMSVGTRQVLWDGNDSRGKPVASGLYLYRLTIGTVSEERKMLLLK